MVADAHRVLAEPAPYVVRNAGAYTDPALLQDLGVGDRIIDLYAVSAAARAAVFMPGASPPPCTTAIRRGRSGGATLGSASASAVLQP